MYLARLVVELQGVGVLCREKIFPSPEHAGRIITALKLVFFF
jgi:hypothetical protein